MRRYNWHLHPTVPCTSLRTLRKRPCCRACHVPFLSFFLRRGTADYWPSSRTKRRNKTIVGVPSALKLKLIYVPANHHASGQTRLRSPPPNVRHVLQNTCSLLLLLSSSSQGATFETDIDRHR
ncbi:unnamed protein product [Ectocarpus sp. 12 AP-2014]